MFVNFISSMIFITAVLLEIEEDGVSMRAGISVAEVHPESHTSQGLLLSSFHPQG